MPSWCYDKVSMQVIVDNWQFNYLVEPGDSLVCHDFPLLPAQVRLTGGIEDFHVQHSHAIEVLGQLLVALTQTRINNSKVILHATESLHLLLDPPSKQGRQLWEGIDQTKVTPLLAQRLPPSAQLASRRFGLTSALSSALSL